jgi:hypothetical protein
MAALEDFLSLITAEHNQRPNFMATVALGVQPYVDGINAANSLIALFDLDTAVGAQLDALGEWVGVTRNVSIQLDVWFALDIIGVGFDQGKWANPYETAVTTYVLDDDHYRLLLRGAIVANYWNGTIPGAYAAWDTLFAGTGYQVLIQDGLTRAERDFSFDTVNCGFDQSIWYNPPPAEVIYFTLDDPALGFDEGYWLGAPGEELLMPWAVDNGNMHIIEALLGPPLDPVTIALFSGGYLGLKSAGVSVDYMIQGQPAVPPEVDTGNGIGLPLFALDVDVESTADLWMSFDDPNAGLDQAPLFVPGTTVPPGSATWPPTPLAGFDLGAWGRLLTGPV